MISLVMGGARSGKSAVAERRAAALDGEVTYVATAAVPEGDEEFAARVAAHRARRPPGWATVELDGADDLAGVLGACRATALVDSLGTWLALLPGFGPDLRPLVSVLRERRESGRTTVLVSDEVGLSVHPSSESGRRFRDALGELNQAVADVADEVLLVVAGRALALPPGAP